MEHSLKQVWWSGVFVNRRRIRRFLIIRPSSAFDCPILFETRNPPVRASSLRVPVLRIEFVGIDGKTEFMGGVECPETAPRPG
jgi:hypothetical protein